MSASPSPSKPPRTQNGGATLIVGILIGGLLGSAAIAIWGHSLGLVANSPQAANDSHDDHDHDHDHGSDGDSIEISEVALRNLGLTEEFLTPIELSSYQKMITLPGVVAELPGRTKIPVSAPMTGIVTKLLRSAGEAVLPATPFVKLRLTHEDLVTLQKDYLRTLGERDVELKEIERLSNASAIGAISPKSLLEREYSRDILNSNLSAQRESLRLHGIRPDQIDIIDRERRLLSDVTILTPTSSTEADTGTILSRSSTGERSQNVSFRPRVSLRGDERGGDEHGGDNSRALANLENENDISNPLVLQELPVQIGQLVTAGEILGVFADYSNLLIEGQAFEGDVRAILEAKKRGDKIIANIVETGVGRPIGEFDIEWIENEIDVKARTLKFFARLENQIMDSKINASGQRFIEWEHRPGQRLQLRVPIETWEEQIVLPVDAVAKDGITSYVFIQNGDSFLRMEVHELYRDSYHVVVANDGAVFPGDVVARRSAHQLLLALKNQSGGAIDPHAGHNH